VRDIVRIILWLLAGLVVALTIAGLADRLALGGRLGWAFDLMSHWPRHLAVVSLVICVLSIWRRTRIPAIAALAATAINAAIVIGAGGFALPQAAPPDARLIRIVSANVHGSLTALAKVAQLGRDYDADIVAVYEAPDEMNAALFDRLFADLPRRLLLSERENGWPVIRRSAIATREGEEITSTMYDGSHGVLLHASVLGVQVTTAHPPSPADPGLKADRDRQLSDIGPGLDQTKPFIIAGDFNSTPWGRAYATVPGTRAGDPRLEGTFPAIAGPLGLPIDHIRFGGGLTLTDYRVGPDIGSDHLPLLATFALPEN